MAEFQVKVMKCDKKTEELPRRGLVNEVCREFLLHEDQALAHRLQNEEYAHHLGYNKERNARLREDTPRAREEQLLEDEAAALAQTNYELQQLTQEAEDAAVAAAIAKQLQNQEMRKLQEQEQKDQDLAKNLFEQEKSAIRQHRELRQVEREAAYLGINSGLDNVALLSRKDHSRDKESSRPDPRDRRRPLDLGDADTLSDLSDLCIQPTDNMAEEEVRSLQEQQDEELAKLLQEQDTKRRGDRLREDQLMAIEAQDRELAKVLQEQERAKAKKAREKARQKALLKKQQRQEQATEQESNEYSSSGSNPSPVPDRLHESQGQSSGANRNIRKPDSPLYMNEVRVPGRIPEPCRPDSLDLPHQLSQRPSNHKPSDEGIGSVDVLQGTYDSPPSIISSCTSTGFTNIACAIDPTYQRRIQQGELSTPSTPANYLSSPHNTSSMSSASSTSSGVAMPSPGVMNISSVSSPITPLPPPVYDEDEDDYPAPPYMPIQGQRRTASLEKTCKTSKLVKEKNNKDNCRQQ